jgi:tRNA threonylcarbamoyladenosine biosynthesis protein TsaE
MVEQQTTMVCRREAELGQIAKEIIAFAGNDKVWLFFGEMGAGKTTLIKSICTAYNVIDPVSSPTFALVNEYRSNENQVFYHFDFYRIQDETEAMDIGCDEYFYSGHHCFIEWPEKIISLFPERYVIIGISVKENQSRNIVLSKHE